MYFEGLPSIGFMLAEPHGFPCPFVEPRSKYTETFYDVQMVYLDNLNTMKREQQNSLTSDIGNSSHIRVLSSGELWYRAPTNAIVRNRVQKSLSVTVASLMPWVAALRVSGEWQHRVEGAPVRRHRSDCDGPSYYSRIVRVGPSVLLSRLTNIKTRNNGGKGIGETILLVIAVYKERIKS